MDLDEEILKKADKWNAEDNWTRRETQKLRHSRLVATGRFFQNVIIVAGLGSLIVGGSWWGCNACNACNAKDAEKARQEREDNRKLDAVYDPAWLRCVEALGLEDCKLVGERAIRTCVRGRCHAGDVMKSRLEQLEAEESKAEESKAEESKAEESKK